jgi:Domain of unknown function (DUF4335)
MTIQRTYNLPNCTLLIEGISPGDSGILSILTNFECKFHHTHAVIAGGRKLLDALVESVGQYAQDLSGGNVVAIAVAPVRLEPINAYAHQLHVEPSDDAGVLDPLAKPLAIRLNTNQLFDLMESIDQLCLDRQTLPDLELVTNTSEVVIQSKTKQRVVPAVMGIAGFAIAASAMFLLPVPKPQPQSQPQSQTSTQIKPKASNRPPAIKDPDLVDELQEDLRKQIQQAWLPSPSFTEAVAYRVDVNAKGQIVKYSRIDRFSPAPEEELEKELPLKKLTVKTKPKTSSSSTKPQPVATFRVTFKPNGTFAVTESK